MIFDNPKSMKNTFQATTFKVEENSTTFLGLAQKFKDFSRKNGIQGLFKTVRTLLNPKTGANTEIKGRVI